MNAQFFLPMNSRLILSSFGRIRCSLPATRGFTSASMSHSDCCATLGLRAGSNEEQIKQAYRKLAKEHHPDLGGNTDKFVRIQRAYEGLMTGSAYSGSSKSGDTARSAPGSSGGSQYWRSWDTGNSWWSDGAGGGSTRYSSDHDFDADFDEQWQKFTRKKQTEKSRKFRVKKGFSVDDDGADSDFEAESSSSGSYSSTRSRTRAAAGTGRQSSKRSREKGPKIGVPDRVNLTTDKTSTIGGDYERVAKFNGRVCLTNRTLGLFLFWSNKNKDWKISTTLKDDGNCLAFYDRVHPSVDCPFVLGESAKWMVWNDRSRRFSSMLVSVDEIPVDYTSWSVEKLREALAARGMKDLADGCFEKSELVELIESTKGSKSSGTDKETPIPPGEFRLYSRQRHDGVVQAPPVMSESCKVGNNRIDKFTGTMDALEAWLLKHGDRRRYYGVFDSDSNFCFGLIWKNNKNWARAGTHDW